MHIVPLFFQKYANFVLHFLSSLLIKFSFYEKYVTHEESFVEYLQFILDVGRKINLNNENKVYSMRRKQERSKQ